MTEETINEILKFRDERDWKQRSCDIDISGSS